MNNKIADRLRTEPMSPGLLRDAINELDVMWSLLQLFENDVYHTDTQEIEEAE